MKPAEQLLVDTLRTSALAAVAGGAPPEMIQRDSSHKSNGPCRFRTPTPPLRA